jgi:hypothetical protein
MAKMTFGPRGGRVRSQVAPDRGKPARKIEDVLKDLKKTSDDEG